MTDNRNSTADSALASRLRSFAYIALLSAAALILLGCGSGSDAMFAVGVDEGTTIATRGGTGTEVQVPLTISRSGGHSGEIDVTANGLPEGVTSQELTVPVNETSAELTLVVESDASLGPVTFQIEGSDGSTNASGDAVLLVKDPAGSYDETFATDGRVVHDFGTNLHAFGEMVEVLDDGKVIVSGLLRDDKGTTGDTSDDTQYLLLARFNEDGTVDSSFGDSGQARHEVDDLYEIRGLAVGSDRILAGFTTASAGLESHIIAFDSDGNLDPEFGTAGIVTPDPSLAVLLVDLTIAADGKVLLTGYSGAGSDDDMAVVRFQADGSLDASFADSGMQLVDFGGTDRGYDLSLGVDGRMVITGWTDVDGTQDFAVARIDPDGGIDTSFAGNGRRVHDFEGAEDVAVAVTAHDDRVFIAGEAATGSTIADRSFGLLALGSDGVPDTSFGSDGEVITDFDGFWDTGTALEVQGDGKVVMAGHANIDAGSPSPSEPRTMAVTRYLTDGTLDGSFHFDGKVKASFSEGTGGASDMSLAPYQRIVVAGAVVDGSKGYLALVRFWQ